MNDPFKEFGEEGFTGASVSMTWWEAFYHQDHLEHAEGRLRDFLIYRFKGSTRYLDEDGHHHLGKRRHWMGIGPLERDRWLEMKQGAMDEVGLTGPARQRL